MFIKVFSIVKAIIFQNHNDLYVFEQVLAIKMVGYGSQIS